MITTRTPQDTKPFIKHEKGNVNYGRIDATTIHLVAPCVGHLHWPPHWSSILYHLQKIQIKLTMNSAEAKQFLADQGIYSDNMWNVNHVTYFYKCTENQAYEILEHVLTSDQILDQIWNEIHNRAKELNLEKL
jgi:hypothetical protein